MMSQDTQTISDYINTVKDFSPEGLHASLSYHMYANARNAIKQFFADPSIRHIAYGWSSGHMRVHILYRHDDGKIYVVHHSYGSYTDAFYFTKSELKDYFEDYENEMPEFEDPVIDEEAISS
jgi:hypothetical protein